MYTSFRPRKTIALIGMMGVGKTSVGRRLAKKLDLAFNDTDYEVELAAGCSISDIYDLYGEQAFKDTEKRVIDRLLSETPHVLSTGVGALGSEITRKLLKLNAVTVWLYADINSIITRVTKRSHRPQLQNQDIRETLERLSKEYHPIYSQADLCIDCTSKEAGETVELILDALRDYLTSVPGLAD